MLKKFTWIAALFAALAMVFAGCSNFGVYDTDEKEYKKIDLGAFNTVAGQPKQQQGWATDGYADGDNPKAADAGLKLADFKAAKYLVIETAQNAEGGLHLVWQSKNHPDSGWRTQDFSALENNSSAGKGVTKTGGNAYGGQTIKIELALIMGATYGQFLDSEDYVRFVLAYYSPDLDALDVKEGYLLIDEGDAPAASPSLVGINPDFGLGDTTIRKSANEYGWQFAKKGTDGKLPEGVSGDIEALRTADYFFFVSKDGGIGAVNGSNVLLGYEELSVVLYVGRSDSYETKLYKDNIEFEHADENVLFVIDLASLNGYDKTIGAKVGGDGTDKNDPKYSRVGITLKYASSLEKLGLVAGYIFTDIDEDEDDDPDFAALVAGGEPLEYEFLGQTTTSPYGVIYSDTSGSVKAFLKEQKIALPALFPSIEEKKGALGDFTKKDSASQFIWGFNGVDGNLDYDLLKNAQYLVLESKGSSKTDSFDGMRVVFQSGAGGWGWHSANPWGNSIKFEHTATETVYIVIDLQTHPNWTANFGGTGTSGKIIIQYWDMIDLGLTDAYLIPATSAAAFAKANFADAKDTVDSGTAGLTFYITKAAGFTTALDTLYGR